jgi:hypothetical protein
MTFTNYLKTKRNFFIFWFLFHGFALFVNVFGSTGGRFEKEIIKPTFTNYGIQDELVEVPFYILTSSSINQNFSENFWPFSIEINNPSSYVYFDGIFYNYDYSEFIAYSILIFLFFYILWETRFNTK